MTCLTNYIEIKPYKEKIKIDQNLTAEYSTNFVFKGLFSKAYPVAPEYLSFPKFSAFSIPYMLMMEGAMYLYLLIVYFGFLRPKSAAAEKAKLTPEGIEAAKKTVTENLQSLGKITFWEIQVIILFSLAIALFFCRAPQIFHGWGDEIVRYFNLEDSKFLMDSAAALFVAFLMLLLPSTLKFLDNFKAKEYDELPNSPIPSVLNWAALNDVMGYSFMFLLGKRNSTKSFMVQYCFWVFSIIRFMSSSWYTRKLNSAKCCKYSYNENDKSGHWPYNFNNYYIVVFHVLLGTSYLA
ncbi:unnamed protein product [Leptidea sinapis]|uniref:Uncharacterized protein n=1 Tax=Leptidea sinapis TaxID=189913 RepID=A0A5E4QM80_9NEOP|nr:unnamed protein product [Leptidea sinapis]